MHVPVDRSGQRGWVRAGEYQFLRVLLLALPYETGKTTLDTAGERLNWRAVKKSHAMRTMSADSVRTVRPYFRAKGRTASRTWCRSSVIMVEVKQGKGTDGLPHVIRTKTNRVRRHPMIVDPI